MKTGAPAGTVMTTLPEAAGVEAAADGAGVTGETVVLVETGSNIEAGSGEPVGIGAGAAAADVLDTGRYAASGSGVRFAPVAAGDATACAGAGAWT